MIAPDADSNLDMFESPSDAVATHLWQMVDVSHYGRVNATHALFVGKQRKDFEYSSVYDLFPRAEADSLVEQNHLVYSAGKPSVHDIWLQNADRESRLLRVIRTPIFNHDGEVLFLSCSAEDRTSAQSSEEPSLFDGKESSDEIVQGKVQQLADALWGTITALVCLAESRDDSTGGHLRRISETCRVIATALSLNSIYNEQLTREFIINLQQACLLHDIGKVGIPDSILLKRGKLTAEEFDEMKKHTTIGAQTLESAYQHYRMSELIKMGIDIALSHHERWDGLGYPNGLKGNDIPLSAQIVAIADVYDALRSTRCYKTASSHEDSLAEIRRDIGHRFNPVIAKAFLRYEREIEQIYQGYDL
jgi:response regulator RpfG family c-di-GMP phosphodiesterase